MRFNRLLPQAPPIGLDELREGLRFPAKDGRPYTVVNFVASVDGRATIEGRSAKLGDDGDRAMFHSLRERVDAILAGTGTLATERYGRMIRTEEARARRVKAGLTAEPLACVVTRSGHVPTEIPLFKEPEARIVVFTATPVAIRAAAQVEVIELDPGELTLLTVLRKLRAEKGINTLMCEGGPTLFGALLREQLVDELFLTVAPKLVGGGQGQTIATGPELAEPASAQPIWVLERNGTLFVRRRVGPPGA